MSSEIKEELTKVLNDAALKLNLKKYSLNIDLNVQIGDGFVGEFYKVSICDEENDNKIFLVLKKAPEGQRRRVENCVEMAYKNETLFYSTVFPILKQLESEHQAESFDSIPGYITSVNEVGKEIIVLKDITAEGFELRRRDLLLDDEHAKLIFQTYGRFHALSFCLKDQKPEVYHDLVKPFYNIWGEYKEKNSFCNILRKIVETAAKSLDPMEDGHILEKFQKYVDHTIELFSESMEYDGTYSGILHGDCWSNNMMFKYQDCKLKAVNLIDFQVVRTGTPVYDLSYFLYTGGSKELFDKLEFYLDIYHKSFSKFAKELGSDSEKLLPREGLKLDWQKYSKFGMLMSLILIKIKLAGADATNRIMDFRSKEELFAKRARDIIMHMYEINAL